MPQFMQCPLCRRFLRVEDHAPPLISCPHCLGTIAAPGHPPILETSTAQTDPRIPFAEEVESDLTGTSRTIVLVAISLIGGGIALYLVTRALLLPGLLVVCGAVLIGLWNAISGAQPLPYQQTPEPPADFPQPGDVLNYAAPYRSDRPGTGAIIGRFIGGFFLGLGLCALFMFLFGGTYDQPSLVKKMIFFSAAGAFIGLAMLAIFLEHRTPLVGLGRGLGVGLVLGLMAVGPCAFCYIGA